MFKKATGLSAKKFSFSRGSSSSEATLGVDVIDRRAKSAGVGDEDMVDDEQAASDGGYEDEEFPEPMMTMTLGNEASIESGDVMNSPASERQPADSHPVGRTTVVEDTKEEFPEYESYEQMKYKIEADRQEEVLNRQKVDDLLSEAADDSALSHLSAEELSTRRTQLSDALQDIIERRNRIQREMEEYEGNITRRIGQPADPTKPITTRSWVYTLFGDFTCATACG